MIVNSSFIITEFNTFFFFVLWMFTVLALFCDSDWWHDLTDWSRSALKEEKEKREFYCVLTICVS